MARVMLVQPWNYHDEAVRQHDLSHEWRNGPYSLLLLATQLKRYHHEVIVVDMIRDLVVLQGNVKACLAVFSAAIERFKPDIIGFGFFSIHFFEVKQAVEVARQTCARVGICPLIVAGGIHASTEPKSTLTDLGFDYSFVGEADLGLVSLASGCNPESVAGVVTSESICETKGVEINPLDDLPFPDWSLCDHRFYGYPSFGKVKFRAAKSLDMITSRGCVYRCAFCAYNALSSVRFYSAAYLVEQMEYMAKEFDIDAIYFTDSTIGNNRRLLTELCDRLIRRGTTQRLEWYANIRPNQVNESLLKLMWRAGCRFLFYGFESGSQRVLDLMVKGVALEANYRAAELHKKLGFPYHASILLGYPGEREEDIQQTFEFLRKTSPPMIGINWYVPLPGSPDYDKLKAEGVIVTADPWEWRRIGEVNGARVYADIPEQRFRQLYAEAERLAYVDTPKKVHAVWGCLAPPQSAVSREETGLRKWGHFRYTPTVRRLLRAVRI